MAIIAASILNADFANLRAEVEKVQAAGVDMFTLDVMDGHFVPNITFGDYLVARVREWTQLPMETHLMVSDPLRWVDRMADAGADLVTFHVEAATDPRPVIEAIRSRGLLVGLAINVDSLVDLVYPWLGLVDLVNLLAVPVGFGGQPFRMETLDRTRALRRAIDTGSFDVAIEIDGGVKPDNSGKIAAAGADVLTVGTGIYYAPDPVAAVRQLKETTAGDVDALARERLVRFLTPRNPIGARSPEVVKRLMKLRENLGIGENSWVIGEPRQA